MNAPADIEQAIRKYIDSTLHMSLATVSASGPWMCELHFAYDDALNLYFRSLSSRRHSQEIAVNASVAGDIIDKYPLGAPVVGLYFEGTAERLGPGGARDEAFICLSRRLSLDKAVLAEADRPDGHQFYRIAVRDWYVFGRFGTPSGQKYHLPWPQPSADLN